MKTDLILFLIWFLIFVTIYHVFDQKLTAKTRDLEHLDDNYLQNHQNKLKHLQTLENQIQSLNQELLKMNQEYDCLLAIHEKEMKKLLVKLTKNHNNAIKLHKFESLDPTIFALMNAKTMNNLASENVN